MSLKRLNREDFKKLSGSADSGTNRNHLILKFIDFDFHPDIITEKTGLQPLSIGLKGEKYFVGKKNQIKKIRDCNYWEYEWKEISNDFIGDLIDRFFVEIIIPKLDLFKEVSHHCEIVRLVIVQYYYTGYNPGYGFTKEQINILSNINADVDVDIYCLCED